MQSQQTKEHCQREQKEIVHLKKSKTPYYGYY
jgi:hypothetical protein